MTFTARICRLIIAICGLSFLTLAAADAAQVQNPAPPSLPQTSQTFRISGTVVNAVTSAPLAQARISIAATGDRGKLSSLITSNDGHFQFSQLKAGKYSLQGAERGFISAAYDQHEQFSTAIVTGSEFSTENLVLRLTPMALIAGHVLDEFGDPVRGARVFLYLENHAAGMTRIIRLSSSSSDDRGFFDFSLLRPGRYYVSVTAKPWYAFHPSTAPDGAPNPAQQISTALDVAYPTTYYSSATEADRATPIDVKAGDRLEIDMHLHPAPALHLLFRIPEGQPDQPRDFSMPTLQKHVFDSQEPVAAEGMRPIARGVYEITGVPPGRYTVRLKNSSTGRLEQSSDLDLLHDGQELNDSHGEPLGSMKLSLKTAADEPLPKQYVVGLQDSRRRMIATRQGDPSGQVSFEDLASGTYAIQILSQLKPYSVARTSSPAGESSGHDVSIKPGAALELTAFLSSGVVTIEGVVHKKDKPVAGVMVALVPKDPASHIELFRRDQSDLDGTFRVAGVIPGFYTIVAVEDAWGFEWLQPGVLAKYVLHGQNLTIGELMRGSVHLPDPVEVQPR
jgi:hypothetical protein